MQLGRILIHPIKSLDPHETAEAEITALGALKHDREWALVDSDDNFVNGKRDARIHLIRAQYTPSIDHVTLSAPSQPGRAFPLTDHVALSAWFSGFLDQPIRLIQDSQQGFPDDLEANGPTVVSTASLMEVGSWFGWSVGETRHRFRSNLEADGTPPFWEDRLFKKEGEFVEFRIGRLMLLGVNPCRRCAVPSRHPATGVPTDGFQKQFMRERERTLPSWAEPSRFDHFHRFAVNTRIAPGQFGTRIRVGDPVALPGLKP